MLLIWRGLGVAAVLIPFLLGWAVQSTTDFIYGSGAYRTHPGITGGALLVSAFLVFALGKRVNRKIPPSEDNPFGREKPLHQHSLFGIPLEYWAIPIALMGTSFIKDALVSH